MADELASALDSLYLEPPPRGTAITRAYPVPIMVYTRFLKRITTILTATGCSAIPAT
jgi:hypothetical protein